LQGIRPAFRFNVVIMSIYLIKRGENMFKKIITAVLATLMFLIVLPTKVLAETPTEQSTENTNEHSIGIRAWPGRPGGNGDGSEEWLHGSYGEMSGPYKLIDTSTGTVEELNRLSKGTGSLADFLVGLGLVQISQGLITILSALSVANNFVAKGYEGIYYKSFYYVSGRCSKLVIYTYSDSNFKNLYKTYTIYSKW
jgi:hypothetical protein